MNTITHPSTRHQSPTAATANTLPETASPASRHSLLAASALIVAIALFATLPAAAAEWAARHGLTGAQYQKAFDDYSSKGYRLTSVSGYESGGAVRYAGVWTKRSGPAWTARHGLTAQQYQAAFDEQSKQGYRLNFVNGYVIGGKPYYAAVWEKKSGPALQARHGLTAVQYQDAVDTLSKQGFALSHVSASSIGGSPRFAAIFEKGGPATAARHGLTSSEYQNAFEDFAKKGYRLKVVSGYRQNDGDRYAAIWAKEGGPQLAARHGIPGAHYQHVFDNYRYQSWEPQYIEAFNSTSGVRFNGVWENTTFNAQDLALIQRKVLGYMKANKVPGMSIAISRNERLVYAAGFGEADKEKKQPVGPAHRFRIASVSKPITHVAVLRVVQDTNLDLTSKVFGTNSVLGGQYSTPSDNEKIEDITVEHLIRHRGGWVKVNKNGNKSDPMFDYASTGSGTGHKGLIEWTLKNYPLGYDPGTENYDADNDPATNDMYSNFGYSLLGRVIEAKSGKGYEAYVRDKILKPAGANSMVVGGDKEADRKENEVKYYGGSAYSSVKPKRFDSHGGWIATPIDLLRFLRHESVLSKSYAHYGEMSGTTSMLRRRSDNISYAAASNASNDSTEQMNAMLEDIVEGVTSWPNHDLF